jgi:hypothetical protein
MLGCGREVVQVLASTNGEVLDLDVHATVGQKTESFDFEDMPVIMTDRQMMDKAIAAKQKSEQQEQLHVLSRGHLTWGDGGSGILAPRETGRKVAISSLKPFPGLFIR